MKRYEKCSPDPHFLCPFRHSMGGADLGATRGRVALDGADNHHGDSECLTMDAMDAMEIMMIGYYWHIIQKFMIIIQYYQ